jgi:hypothetical protein
MAIMPKATTNSATRASMSAKPADPLRLARPDLMMWLFKMRSPINQKSRQDPGTFTNCPPGVPLPQR